ncbi:MAG: peptidase M50 [Methanolinea sp.]|nr:peptidase M50 [Methanolinea sp.]
MLERITRRERSDLLIAWLAISIAFSLVFIRGGVTLELFLVFLLVSMVTVGIGFILHEMAHKFTAMKYGFWAEFQKDNLMLLVAVAMAALVGVVFAAPGATLIYGTYISREQNGKISAAGPAVNLALCGIFALLLWASGTVFLPFLSRNLLSLIGMVGLQVNAMIAAFNMLPVSVLDGKKILAWNPVVFAIMIVAAFGILLASYFPAIL